MQQVVLLEVQQVQQAVLPTANDGSNSMDARRKGGGGCIRTGMSAGFIAPSPWLIRQMLEKKVLAGECVSLLVSSKDVFI